MGDLVLSRDEVTGELSAERVVGLIRSVKHQEWVTLTFDTDKDNGETDGEIQTETVNSTANHPFNTPQGWKDASDLTVGSQVLTSTNETATVTSVKAWTALERAYNLTVENTHTYLISDSHLWVHNSSCKDRSGKHFTQKGKREVIENNKAENGGKMICANPFCQIEMIPAKRSVKGVKTDPREVRVDHIIPRIPRDKDGIFGAGTPDNGQAICSACNLFKSNKSDFIWTEESVKGR